MQRLNDFKSYEWIKNNTTKSNRRKEDWTGNPVSCCIPPVFEKYAKIFHPIYIDKSIKDTEISWDEYEKRGGLEPKENSIPSSLEELKQRSTLVYGGIRNNADTERIKWQDLTHKYGLTFHSEIDVTSFTRNFPGRSWPRYLIGPAEGKFDIQHCEQLVLLLSEFSHSLPCYFYYDSLTTGYRHPRLLYQGRLTEVLETYKLEDVFGSPEYWWPEDQSWCINTDWDLTFTLIGGGKDLIDAILGDSFLESVEVKRTSRIDYFADQINR